LWESWESPEGDIIETFAILTTKGNDILRPIYDRMPVILRPKYYELWLDPNFTRKDKLQELLKPYAAEEMISYAVSSIVNSPKNDCPKCKESIF
jgi:putative SOS response-associated peptidase YedK